MTDFDGKEFRSALGSFATGVTIVTTAPDCASPVGVTASSFNSVSLDPPLVLWSLAKKSLSLAAFRDAGHFAIHILSCHQEELSNAFARSGADKFAGVDWQPGVLGSPLFDEFAARFECKTVHQYAGGDHIIFVGEVFAFEKRDHAPLVFHGGSYAEAKPRLADDAGPTVELHEGRFTEDFFLYLLARAHFQTSYRTRRKLADVGMSEGEYLALSVLSIGGEMPPDALREQLDHTGFAIDDALVGDLTDRGYIEAGERGLRQTEAGRALFIEILSAAKAFEDDLLKHLSGNEIAETRRVLKKLIAITGNDIPSLWSYSSRP